MKIFASKTGLILLLLSLVFSLGTTVGCQLFKPKPEPQQTVDDFLMQERPGF